MSQQSMGDEPTELVKVEVRLSRHLHYAPDGHYLTLCGCVAQYQLRYGWPKPPCGRCTREAIAHRWAIPG